MDSSSSAPAPASVPCEGNRADPVCQAPPPPAMPLPPVPVPVGHPVFIQHIYQDPPDFQRRELAFLFRSLTFALILFLVTAIFAFVIWVVLNPNSPRLFLASAVLSNFATSGSRVTADCNFTLLLSNTNSHLNTFYDHFEIYLLYPSQEIMLSQDLHPPFVHHKKSQIAIDSNLSITNAFLGPDVVQAMLQDLDGGILGLGVKVFAELSFRTGKWKTHNQFMRASCGVVLFGFNSSKQPETSFDPPIECDVYLDTK